MSTEIAAGTTITHRRVIEGSDTELWGETVRFSAVVDTTDGDYIEATVTRANRHRRAPDTGSELALSQQRIAENDNWEVER